MSGALQTYPLGSYGWMATRLGQVTDYRFQPTSTTPLEMMQPNAESATAFIHTLSPPMRPGIDIPPRMLDVVVLLTKAGIRVRTFGWLAQKFTNDVLRDGQEMRSATPDVVFSDTPNEQEIKTFLRSTRPDGDLPDVCLQEIQENSNRWMTTVTVITEILKDGLCFDDFLPSS